MQGAWYGTYYTYHILHSDGVFDTTDPYGVASGIDSERSMVVNLAETDPAGWEQDERPEIRPEDRCVYELHVKDFRVIRIPVFRINTVESFWRLRKKARR